MQGSSDSAKATPTYPLHRHDDGAWCRAACVAECCGVALGSPCRAWCENAPAPVVLSPFVRAAMARRLPGKVLA